ncbi:MAG TPA: cysteine methyltransferase [Acidimicrobiaceae bacterium]|nr:cysteine methyltransferase [Acidimicrobiaceae bacterium]
MTDTFQTQLDSPVGVLTLVASDEGLRKVLLEGQAEQAGDATPAEFHQILAAASAQLAEYFAGDRVEFDLPLDLIGTDFQKAAWLALADVPYGETSSYGEQAERIGRTGAFRAVGAANSKNPIPIVLPCHRIVGADGSLTGFAGGLAMKQRLLALEQDQQSFDI